MLRDQCKANSPYKAGADQGNRTTSGRTSRVIRFRFGSMGHFLQLAFSESISLSPDHSAIEACWRNSATNHVAVHVGNEFKNTGNPFRIPAMKASAETQFVPRQKIGAPFTINENRPGCSGVWRSVRSSITVRTPMLRRRSEICVFCDCHRGSGYGESV